MTLPLTFSSSPLAPLTPPRIAPYLLLPPFPPMSLFSPPVVAPARAAPSELNSLPSASTPSFVDSRV